METTFNFTDYSELSANTGMVNIATANANLDGTGALTGLLTGAANGTIINSVIIKATQATTQGMIRFFVNDSTGTQLLQEVPVPALTPTAVEPSFETRISLDINLAAGNRLYVSTENAESFNIIAEGLDWVYPATPACCDHMKRSANNGLGLVNTANPNLDGTGTIQNIMTATQKGTTLETVHIKGQASTTQGMIRLFINNGIGGANFLFTEIQIGASTQTAIVPSTINRSVYYNLIFKSVYKLAASTENADTFSIIMNGLNWQY
ncbi:MAG TPA: hypothetical protein PKC41_01265 [Chitinophagaceae bacterium]|jgi:hypothetical protein|nr:hypothetical protein [Chitinophagaceae bacterium]